MDKNQKGKVIVIVSAAIIFLILAIGIISTLYNSADDKTSNKFSNEFRVPGKQEFNNAFGRENNKQQSYDKADRAVNQHLTEQTQPIEQINLDANKKISEESNSQAEKVKTKQKIVYIEKPAKKEKEAVSQPSTGIFSSISSIEKKPQVQAVQETLNAVIEEPEEILIRAVINRTQNIRTGDRIELRIEENTTVNGKPIRKNTFVKGTVNIIQNRATINIFSIPTSSGRIAVNLEAYDADDGITGIPIEGGVPEEALRQEGTNAVQPQGSITAPFVNIPLNVGKRVARTPAVEIRGEHPVFLKVSSRQGNF